MRKLAKKGEVFGNLASLGIGVAVIVVIVIVTFMITAEGRKQIGTIEGTACSSSTSAGCNATNTLNSAVSTIPDFLPIIIICGIGVVLIGMVYMFAKSRSNSY